jgi:hypothetical protein
LQESELFTDLDTLIAGLQRDNAYWCGLFLLLFLSFLILTLACILQGIHQPLSSELFSHLARCDAARALRSDLATLIVSVFVFRRLNREQRVTAKPLTFYPQVRPVKKYSVMRCLEIEIMHRCRLPSPLEANFLFLPAAYELLFAPISRSWSSKCFR